MRRLTLSPAVYFGLFFLGLAGCAKDDAAPAPDVRSVRVEQMGATSAQSETSYAGEVRPRFETDLAFRVGGRITARRAEVGSRVVAGQLIATLDPQDYALAASAANSQRMAADAEARLAQQDLARFTQLREQNFISQAELDRRTSTTKTTLARAQQLRAEATRQANQRAYTRLSAPYAGIITRINAEPGEVVAAGQAVAQLARTGELDAVINVPENELAKLKIGQALAIRLWSSPGKTYAGTLRELSPVADPATRTYVARVAFTHPDPEVKLGMTATVSRNTTASASLSVAQTALFRVDGQPQVWVVNPATKKVAPRTVRLGGLVGERATVTAGLASGEWVVTAGVHKLAPGQEVKLLTTVSRL